MKTSSALHETNVARLQHHDCCFTLNYGLCREAKRSAKRNARNALISYTFIVVAFHHSLNPNRPQTFLSINFSEACTFVPCSKIRTKNEMEKQLRFCSSFYDAHKLPPVCPGVKPLKMFASKMLLLSILNTIERYKRRNIFIAKVAA